ncbi:cytochrome c maturation protein CcmE [Kangiella japonica]|uniref:Cytochrome c-type biogenesis protein CcmE n=1 Tax=Kangiella japonica TaxID=647384 RepID=A0ABN0T7M4_9GAMM
MKTHRRNKLIAIIGGLVLISGAVALILYALSSNINHFYPPTEVSQGKAPMDRTIRVGGLVAYNSVKRADDGLEVVFTVTDNQNTLDIRYEGILPDLFKEGQGVIAEGKLVSKTEFKATKVLAKHDEKYMPPEVEQSLEKYGHPVQSKSTEY